MGLGVSIRVNGMVDDRVAGAVSVEVMERMGQPTQYRLNYDLDIEDGDFPLLRDGLLGPGTEISIAAPSGGRTECLVKGPVYGQDIHFAHDGAGSSLVVQGADSLIALDREDKVTAWSDLTDSDAVTSILSHAGFVSDVERTQAGHFERKHTLIQRETDLAFLRRLARRNGYLLWVSCNESGMETVHFKRPVLEGEPACELVMSLTTPHANVMELDVSWDVERPTKADAMEVDLGTKAEINGSIERSPLPALGGQGLADVVSEPRVTHLHAPVDDGGDLRARCEGAVIDASFFVKATGATTVSALGKVMRAHTLVKLRGIGSRHSGLWFCSSVRHVIDESEHRMEFELIRNGWAE